MRLYVEKIIIVAAVLGLLSGISAAKVKIADKIFLDAEFRPRLEIDGRDFSEETGWDSYSTFRARLGLELDGFIENTSIYMMIGDSRLMGYSDPYLMGKPVGPNRFDNNLGVIKAYIEARELIGCGSYLKVGRMSNDQGRTLIFGPGNWNVFGPRTYDGIKGGYRGGRFTVNLWHLYGKAGDRHWYSIPGDPSKYPDPALDYKRDNTLTGLDVSLLERRVNLLAFLDLDQAPLADTVHGGSHPAFSRFTVAVNLDLGKNESSRRWLDFDLAYQFGRMGHVSGEGEISGYMAAGDLGMMFYQPFKFFGGAGFHLLSGDDGLNQERVTYFYDGYSSRHRMFGHMDYFKSIPGERSLGLRDLILRGGMRLFDRLDCNLDFHYFTVEKPFASAVDGADSRVLGQELDTTLKYDIREGLKAQLGVDFFFPSEDWQGKKGEVSGFVYLLMSARI